MIHELSIRTDSQECLVEITDQVARVARESGVAAGVALLYVIELLLETLHLGH